MNGHLRNQYDSLYASNEVVFGEGKPIVAVQKIKQYINSGKVIDIGGGEGRNALYLAVEGFDVLVTDLSKVGLDKLQEATREKSLSVKTKVSDVLEEGIEGEYDVVVISMVMHHMQDGEAKRLIKEAQEHTSLRGVHIIETFSNEGDLFKRNSETGRFYPSEETIRDLYEGWSIKELLLTERTTLARNKQGERMKNFCLTLIAVKVE